MKYETPAVTDFGSVAAHTFQHVSNGSGHSVHKDHNVCETDKFGEYSCSGGGSIGS